METDVVLLCFMPVQLPALSLPCIIAPRWSSLVTENDIISSPHLHANIQCHVVLTSSSAFSPQHSARALSMGVVAGKVPAHLLPEKQ